ncbi:hypothetical protein GTX23_22405, partial [Streptomyces sp. SID6139]|nr:hypothetical protein [Streptomyces sp. SID6139]
CRGGRGCGRGRRRGRGARRRGCRGLRGRAGCRGRGGCAARSGLAGCPGPAGLAGRGGCRTGDRRSLDGPGVGVGTRRTASHRTPGRTRTLRRGPGVGGRRPRTPLGRGGIRRRKG